MRFTDAKIRAIPKPVSRKVVWEGDSGFGIRVETTGSKIFVQSYRFGGKFHIITLGKYPMMSLAQANTEAAKVREKLSKGIDPKESIELTRRASREAYTVIDLCDEFLEKWSRPNPQLKRVGKKTWPEDERCIKKEVIPGLGGRKASDIRRRDIILILDKIVERGAPQMANRTLNILTKLFNFAVSRDILDTSPCAAIPMPAKKIPRDRVLSADEIKLFWDKLEVSGISEPCQLALKLALVTGQRRGEIVSAEWSEMDLVKMWWSIPKEKSKNGKPHRVALSGMAVEILSRLKELSGDSRYLFPSDRTDSHIDPRAVTRALRLAQPYLGYKKDEGFTVHDLRRSVATMLGEAKFNNENIARILNHTLPGVTQKIYNQYSYDDEKREILEAWARKLESIISGEPAGKIVALHAGRVAK